MLTHGLNENLVSLVAPETFAAEQYLGLRLKLERLRQARDVRVIAVTSPGTGDGKTLTSINIAGALARGAGDRILLIDADLRSPSVDTSLALTGGGAPGLADFIMNTTLTLDDIVQRPEHVGFAVVPAGDATVPAHEILRSARLDELLSDARQRFDYVLLDTPPLVPVFDAALLSRSVDGVVIVVAAHKTPRKQLEEALNLLDPAKVLGIVFNNDTTATVGRYDSYYRRRVTAHHHVQ
jgi:capsular exopolysaccharide synthesis family protein